MRLISPFHDYYDTALGLGVDQTVVFKRITTGAHAQIAHLPWSTPLPDRRHYPGGIELILTAQRPERDRTGRPIGWTQRTARQGVLRRSLVLIAGRAHEVWATPDGSIGAPTAAGALERLRRHLEPNTPSDAIWTVVGSPVPARTWVTDEECAALGLHPPSNRWMETSTNKTLTAEANRRFQEARTRDWTDAHLALDAPVLLLGNDHSSSMWVTAPATGATQTAGGEAWSPTDPVPPAVAFARTNAGITLQAVSHTTRTNTQVIRNPLLRDLGVAALIDPYACFQSIAQFVGGVAPGRTMPMVVLSDKDQVRKKGFDEEYGFRTRPPV